jgi:PPE-repeat protein
MAIGETISTWLWSGPGSSTFHSAATALQDMVTQITGVLGGNQVNGTALFASWASPTGEKAVSANAPYQAWLTNAGQQIATAATQIHAAGAAFDAAKQMTPTPAQFAMNNAQFAMLVATNILGQNTPAIIANRVEYAMYTTMAVSAYHLYSAESASTAGALQPLSPPPTSATPAPPGVGGAMAPPPGPNIHTLAMQNSFFSLPTGNPAGQAAPGMGNVPPPLSSMAASPLSSPASSAVSSPAVSALSSPAGGALSSSAGGALSAPMGGALSAPMSALSAQSGNASSAQSGDVSSAQSGNASSSGNGSAAGNASSSVGNGSSSVGNALSSPMGNTLSSSLGNALSSQPTSLLSTLSAVPSMAAMAPMMASSALTSPTTGTGHVGSAGANLGNWLGRVDPAGGGTVAAALSGGGGAGVSGFGGLAPPAPMRGPVSWASGPSAEPYVDGDVVSRFAEANARLATPAAAAGMGVPGMMMPPQSASGREREDDGALATAAVLYRQSRDMPVVTGAAGAQFVAGEEGR